MAEAAEARLTAAELMARLEAARDELNFAIGHLHGIPGTDTARHHVETAHRTLYNGIPHRTERPAIPSVPETA